VELVKPSVLIEEAPYPDGRPGYALNVARKHIDLSAIIAGSGKMKFSQVTSAAVTTFAILAAGTAFAQQACDVEPGTVISLTEIDPILETMSGLKKDEFETTADFEARVKDTVKKAVEGSVFLQTHHDEGSAIYDADQSAWFITEYFPTNSSWNFSRDAVEEAGLSEAGPQGSVMLIVKDEVVDTYEAQNAMGASAVISKVEATRVGVLEIAEGSPIATDWWKIDFFDMPESITYTIPDTTIETQSSAITIPMQPNEARVAKGSFKFAVYAELVEPFILRNQQHIDATMDTKREATINSTFLVADVKCGFVTDQSNKVIAVVGMAEPF